MSNVNEKKQTWTIYRYIYLVDLMRFIGEDEALKTMSLFEGAQETKKITRKALKNWVVMMLSFGGSLIPCIL